MVPFPVWFVPGLWPQRLWRNKKPGDAGFSV